MFGMSLRPHAAQHAQKKMTSQQGGSCRAGRRVCTQVHAMRAQPSKHAKSMTAKRPARRAARFARLEFSETGTRSMPASSDDIDVDLYDDMLAPIKEASSQSHKTRGLFGGGCKTAAMPTRLACADADLELEMCACAHPDDYSAEHEAGPPVDRTLAARAACEGEGVGWARAVSRARAAEAARAAAAAAAARVVAARATARWAAQKAGWWMPMTVMSLLLFMLSAAMLFSNGRDGGSTEFVVPSSTQESVGDVLQSVGDVLQSVGDVLQSVGDVEDGARPPALGPAVVPALSRPPVLPRASLSPPASSGVSPQLAHRHGSPSLPLAAMGAPCPPQPSTPPSMPLAPPDQQPLIASPASTWIVHPNLNCWPGHGGGDLDPTPVANATTLSACQQACEALPACEGVVVVREGSKCYRKVALQPRLCADDGDWAFTDMYLIARAVPPPPARPPGAPPPPTPPARPPGAPPPPTPPGKVSTWPGPLNAAKCDAMLRDETHQFRRMWAAEAWAKMHSDTAACWERQRDAPDQAIPTDRYFEDTLAGRHCYMNWYEGGGLAKGARASYAWSYGGSGAPPTNTHPRLTVSSP